MPTISSSKRSPAGSSGVKLLITTASLAATLGGWYAFSTQPTPAPADNQAATSLESALGLQPIPTLVTQPGDIATNRQTSQSIRSPHPAQPGLRVVSAPPPAPVTLTRSSR